MLKNLISQKNKLWNSMEENHTIINVTLNINHEKSSVLYFNGDIRSVSINQLNNFAGIIISACDYTKNEIKNIKSNIKDNVNIIFIVKNVYDIGKIRSFLPKLVIISSKDNHNPLVLKMNIDWECDFIYENHNENIATQLLLEYGFSGSYNGNEMVILKEKTENNNHYLTSLYAKKSSIRPLLKATGVESVDEMEICVNHGIDLVGLPFKSDNQNNIIELLENKEYKNIIKSLEVTEELMLNKAVSLANNYNNLCIENNSHIKGYIPKSYNLISENSNSLSPNVISENHLEHIKDNKRYWLALSKGKNIENIIKQYNIELILFNIKEYNTEEKIIKLKKLVKYKQ